MKKQYKKIILLTGIGLLISFLLKASKKTKSIPKPKIKMSSNKFINFKPAEILKLTSIEQNLINAGFSGDLLNFALAQLLFETGKFTTRSNVAIANNNYSGIKWLDAKRQVATKGTPVPPNERYKDPNNPLNFYAKFADADAWAKDYKRILSFGAKPINATDLKDFVMRLKRNSYFGGKPGSEIPYYNGSKMYYDMLNL
jgi:hypothetical protein